MLSPPQTAGARSPAMQRQPVAVAMQRQSGGWPTDENHDPAATGMQEKWDQGEVDRMQSFGAPAVELGKAPAQLRRTPSCKLTPCTPCARLLRS